MSAYHAWESEGREGICLISEAECVNIHIKVSCTNEVKELTGFVTDIQNWCLKP